MNSGNALIDLEQVYCACLLTLHMLTFPVSHPGGHLSPPVALPILAVNMSELCKWHVLVSGSFCVAQRLSWTASVGLLPSGFWWVWLMRSRGGKWEGGMRWSQVIYSPGFSLQGHFRMTVSLSCSPRLLLNLSPRFLPSGFWLSFILLSLQA